MAYVTTETAVATMIIMVLVAGYLLTRRAADFAKAEPTSTLDPPLAHPVHVSPDPQRVSRRQLNLTGSSGPAGRAPARGVAVGRGGASTVLAAATVGEHMPELIGRMGHANTSARSESCKRSYLGNGPTHSIGSPGALRAPTGAAPTR